MVRGVFDKPPSPRQSTYRWGWRLKEAAFVLLLCCLAGRCFVQELQFRLSPLRGVLSPVIAPDAAHSPTVGREELSRVTYAAGLLLAGGLAALGAAVSGRLVLCRVWMAGLIVVFAGAALVSAARAADKAGALLVWLDQVSVLSACFAAAQLCADRRRWRLLLSVLLALGIAMAIKGLWQYFVEAADRLAYFQAYGAAQPAGPGAQEADRAREMLEERLKEQAPLGYAGLANAFASLLILLASAMAGVAAEAVRRAADLLRDPARPKGDIPAPVVAAGAAVAALLAAILTLALTMSRAGIACAALAVVVGAGIGACRRRLAMHWKKAVASALLAAVLLGAGVTAYGLRRDCLPGKSMTFRWFYWTASAEIIRENPLWGVGGGNFCDAYLRCRRPQAEEEVRDPHNFILHALAQFGLAGGVPYLAIVAMVIVCLARPAPCHPQDVSWLGDAGCTPKHTVGGGTIPAAGAGPSRRGVLAGGGAAVTLAVLLSRAAFGGLGADLDLLVVEVAWPAAIFALALLLSLWITGLLGGPPIQGAWPRVALAVGAAAFLLHNTVEFGLWLPGLALLFWTAAGACLAQSGGGRRRDFSRLRWPVAMAALAPAVVVGLLLWGPIFRKGLATQEAADLWHEGQAAGAIAAAQWAAEADGRDDIAAGDVAKMVLAAPAAPEETARRLEKARLWADEAVRRNPQGYSNWQLSARVDWFLAVPDSLIYARRALDGNLDEEVRRLRMLSSQHPDSPMIFASLGHVESARGRFVEAARYYVEAARCDPNSSFLCGCLGDALWRVEWFGGPGGGAQAAWRQAAERFPAGPAVREALGRMEGAVERNPADAHLRLAYARMLCEAGDGGECLRQIAKAQEINGRLIEFAKTYPPPAKTVFQLEDLAQIEMLTARAQMGRP